MFEKIIIDLHDELDKHLQPSLKKCNGLIQKETDSDKKVKLLMTRDKISTAIDRAALSLDLLEFNASLEISPDWKVIKVL